MSRHHIRRLSRWPEATCVVCNRAWHQCRRTGMSVLSGVRPSDEPKRRKRQRQQSWRQSRQHSAAHRASELPPTRLVRLGEFVASADLRKIWKCGPPHRRAGAEELCGRCGRCGGSSESTRHLPGLPHALPSAIFSSHPYRIKSSRSANVLRFLFAHTLGKLQHGPIHSNLEASCARPQPNAPPHTSSLPGCPLRLGSKDKGARRRAGIDHHHTWPALPIQPRGGTGARADSDRPRCRSRNHRAARWKASGRPGRASARAFGTMCYRSEQEHGDQGEPQRHCTRLVKGPRIRRRHHRQRHHGAGSLGRCSHLCDRRYRRCPPWRRVQ